MVPMRGLRPKQSIRYCTCFRPPLFRPRQPLTNACVARSERNYCYNITLQILDILYPSVRAAKFLDRTAIGLSLLCLVHCLMLPIAIVLLPLIGVGLLGDHSFHQVLLLLVVPVSLAGIGLGFPHHKDVPVLLLGTGGMVVLLIVAIYGHTILPLAYEPWLTTLGGLTLAVAHFRNFRLCRTH
jgi:hypothetical protein